MQPTKRDPTYARFRYQEPFDEVAALGHINGTSVTKCIWPDRDPNSADVHEIYVEASTTACDSANNML